VLPGLETAVRQASSLEEQAHRPWPLPEGTWAMAQSWEHLLFAHWPVPADELVRLLPPALPLDTFEGDAWLGVTPFRLSGLRPHGVAPLPVLSSSLELNVRTYVTLDGKPGIWFFSLDASSRLFVEAARALFALPYARARMSCWRHGDRFAFRSERDDRRLPPASFLAEYEPSGAVTRAEPGSLEHFLVERYCLYALRRESVERTEIHHRPWPLQPAEAVVAAESQLPPGVALPSDSPVLHFADRLDVLVWRPAPTLGC